MIFRALMGTAEVSKRMIASTKCVRSRDTTRSEDEPLRTATILNLGPDPLLTVDAMEERMERFYDLVGSFDPRIIFITICACGGAISTRLQDLFASSCPTSLPCEKGAEINWVLCRWFRTVEANLSSGWQTRRNSCS